MTRGRKRAHSPRIPKHIDQTRLPAGIYFEPSGNGRWYVREPRADEPTRTRTITVAQRSATLSELHAIMERRAGRDATGTVGHLAAALETSPAWRALSDATRADYAYCAAILRGWKLATGATFDTLQVDKLSPPVIRRLIDAIADGADGTRADDPAKRKPRPAKANHVLRYLRRLFAWGVERGACATNPAKGVKQVTEVGAIKMPSRETLAAVVAFAYQRGKLAPHSKGSSPAYLAPMLELSFMCRLRGSEAIALRDSDATAAGVLARRLKGSRDNVTKWDAAGRLRAAWDAAEAARAANHPRVADAGRQVPDTGGALFLSQSGAPLSKDAQESAFEKLIAAAIDAGVISAGDRFTLHGLKHRGVTDSAGDKQRASGHRNRRMADHYDHEIAEVDAAGAHLSAPEADE